VPSPDFKRQEYTFEQFIKELVQPNELLKAVNVKKTRHITVINECIVETAETEFNGIPLKTICIEHIDPQNVINTVRQLGLEKYENINYIKAMKKAVGIN
jgi:hypothetical protein